MLLTVSWHIMVNFQGVKNYIALIGEKSGGLDEAIGYYGKGIALKVQQIGLNTCWVAQTFSKRKSKSITELSKCTTKMPDWFKRGMETALLAPTDINQQKILLTLTDKGVKAESTD